MYTMKQTLILALVLLLIPCFASQVYSQESKQLFQKGLMVENGEGNLQEAINIYEQIVDDENAESAIKAKAQLHIGLCYEKLGKTEAINAYKLVLENYNNYKEEAEVASTRLSELITEEKDDDFKMINLYEKDAGMENVTVLEGISISPDGSTLLGIDFSDGQNVVTQDRKTKEIKRITDYSWTDPAKAGVTYYPIWSPNGKEVAYRCLEFVTKDYMELKISSLSGEKQTLVSKKDIADIIPSQWTKDGKYILTYFKDTVGVFTIVMVSVEDGSITPLHQTQWSGKFVDGGASVSPDGKYVVFSDGPSDKLDLYIIESHGGSPIKITNFPMNEKNPLWSPDGEYIVFLKETRGESFLYRMKMKDGKAEEQAVMLKGGMQNYSLSNWNEHGICCNMSVVLQDIYTMAMNHETGMITGDPVQYNYAPSGYNLTPTFSHDGRYLAFYSQNYGPELVIRPLDGGEDLHFPIDADGFWVMTAHSISWLPDNRAVAFCVIDSDEKTILYLLDISTGEWNSRPLPITYHTSIGWGPDNKTLIYYDKSEESGPGISQLNLETNESEQLVKIEEDEEYYFILMFKLSQDYKKITFTMNRSKLMVYNLETGEGGVFAENYKAPVFSPDGKKILTIKKQELFVFSSEGEVLQQYDISKSFEEGTIIYGFDWSPDGKEVVFNTRKWLVEDYLMKNVLK